MNYSTNPLNTLYSYLSQPHFHSCQNLNKVWPWQRSITLLSWQVATEKIKYLWSSIIRLTSCSGSECPAMFIPVTQSFSRLHKHHTSALIWGGVWMTPHEHTSLTLSAALLSPLAPSYTQYMYQNLHHCSHICTYTQINTDPALTQSSLEAWQTVSNWI